MGMHPWLMCRRALLALVAALTLLLTLWAASPAAQSASSFTMIISLDGFRAEYLDRPHLAPNLHKLIARAPDGLRARYMLPSFPSITFPNHYTLVTGRYPSEHGIVSNAFYDPALNASFYYTDPKSNADARFWAAAEPVWATAERQGRATAVSSWPGSEVAHGGHGRNGTGGIRPSLWLHYHSWTAAQRVAAVAGWLDPHNVTGLVQPIAPADSDDWPGFPGRKRAQWPHYPPPTGRPDFVAAYFPDVDQAGHKYGPESPEVETAIAVVDGAVGDLANVLRATNLWDTANIIIVSDHGMVKAAEPNGTIATGDAHRLSLRRALGEYHDVVIVRDRWPIVMLEPRNSSETLAVYHRLKLAARNYTVHLRESLPSELKFDTNPRIPPVIVIPDNGFQFEDIPDEELPVGMHGYVPDVRAPEMDAIFLARGPLFREPSKRYGGLVPAFENVEVYNILCRALGIRPAKNSGRGLSWLP